MARAATAGWVGSALEYYDFFLYATAAVLFLGPLYFPSSEPGLANLAAIASVGAGYISRPIGAILFGYLGDVYGRRMVLQLTLLLMGVSTCLMGVLPTYQEVGIAAPISLVCLRLLQGIAVSGEQPGAHTLLLELSEKHQRGFYTSFAVSGSQGGFVLASVAYIPLSLFLSEAELQTWGWRIPFLLSVVLVAVGIWVRIRLPESPVFFPQVEPDSPRSGPLKTLWTHYKLEILRVMLAAQVSVTVTIFAVFSLAWAVNQIQIPRATMLGVLVASAMVGVLITPAWAHLSDRIGRRRVFMFGAVASGVLVWPYLWAVSRSEITFIYIFGILLAGLTYNAANGVWPSLYGEMFSTKVRMSGMAIGTQLGFMLAAQAPTVATWLTRHTPSEWIPAAYFVSISCAVSGLAVLFSTETSQTNISDLGKKPAQ